MEENYYKIAVVGGGASGLVSAIFAEGSCDSICILEGEERIGKKILITGDGKCNLTNRNLSIEHYHSSDKDFVNKVLSKFSNTETEKFFHSLGLLTRTEEDGRVYPYSFQASSVLDVLRFSVSERSIEVKTGFKVKNIKVLKDTFEIEGEKSEKVFAKKVILACGGIAAPFTGSDGSGFKIAEQLGHRIIKPLPALVQLKLNSPHLKSISGVRVNAEANLVIEGKAADMLSGEVLFTNYGASGPVILGLSFKAAIALSMKKKVLLNINLLPDLSKEKIKETLFGFFSNHPERTISEILIGLLNKRLIPAVLKSSNIDIHKKAKLISREEVELIVKTISSFEFEVIGTLSFRDAQSTSGGVSLKEVDPETMESKLVENLFFAGEILDCTGDSGGYNLQWAWSTGFVAGISASSEFEKRRKIK